MPRLGVVARGIVVHGGTLRVARCGHVWPLRPSLLRRVGPLRATEFDLVTSVDQTEVPNAKSQIAVGVSDRRALDWARGAEPGTGSPTAGPAPFGFQPGPRKGVQPEISLCLEEVPAEVNRGEQRGHGTPGRSDSSSLDRSLPQAVSLLRQDVMNQVADLQGQGKFAEPGCGRGNDASLALCP